MKEIWLRANRRIVAISLVTPTALAVVCSPFALGLIVPLDWAPIRAVAAAIALVAVTAGLLLAWIARQPRLAYHDGHLYVYLGANPPFAVPIQFVEGFLLGQGPSWLGGKKHRRTETTTLVVRLAERAVEWSHREVHPILGSWCDGYITIRGTWCEPLSLDLVSRLNLRLHQVQSARKHGETAGQRA